MRRGRVIEGGAILLLLVALGACKQGEGDRCQLDSDCGTNLRCCVANPPAARAIGGVCTVHLVDSNGNVILDKCELPTTADSGLHLEARVLRDTGGKEAGTPDRGTDRALPDRPPANPDAKTGQ